MGHLVQASMPKSRRHSGQIVMFSSKTWIKSWLPMWGRGASVETATVH
jgi:hypothetical protein